MTDFQTPSAASFVNDIAAELGFRNAAQMASIFANGLSKLFDHSKVVVAAPKVYIEMRDAYFDPDGDEQVTVHSRVYFFVTDMQSDLTAGISFFSLVPVVTDEELAGAVDKLSNFILENIKTAEDFFAVLDDPSVLPVPVNHIHYVINDVGVQVTMMGPVKYVDTSLGRVAKSKFVPLKAVKLEKQEPVTPPQPDTPTVVSFKREPKKK